MEIRKAGINVKNAATGSATLSPDGRCLFFSRSGDIYWVSTKIIGDMKKEVFNTRIINY